MLFLLSSTNSLCLSLSITEVFLLRRSLLRAVAAGLRRSTQCTARSCPRSSSPPRCPRSPRLRVPRLSLLSNFFFISLFSFFLFVFSCFLFFVLRIRSKKLKKMVHNFDRSISYWRLSSGLTYRLSLSRGWQHFFRHQ